MRIKLTPEQLKENRKVASKIYRDNMPLEMRAKIADSKRKGAEKRKVQAKEERAAYYQVNKEHMNAKSKEYHRKAREKIAAEKAAGINVPPTAHAPRVRKVMNQPANMTTLKDEAKKMGIATVHLRTIQKDARFNMPKSKMLRIDGMELFDIYEMAAWQQQYREVLAQETISGASKNKKGITLSKDVILITAWLQASKHVTKYCNAQRVAINSNQFWVRWA